MKRAELISRARALAPPNGFVLDSATATVKKALSLLALDRRVESPRTGWWRIAIPDSTPGQHAETGGPVTIESEPPEEKVGLAAVAGPTSRIVINREIGNGPESVYVYYHDAYADQARLNGSSVWECKVGSTVGEPDARVIGQGALTAFPRPPIIGLVIRTEDGRNLERALHSALTLVGRRVEGGGGSEWFMTSPEQIERWVQAFWGSLTLLGNSQETQKSVVG
jgi:T5orf172 domain